MPVDYHHKIDISTTNVLVSETLHEINLINNDDFCEFLILKKISKSGEKWVENKVFYKIFFEASSNTSVRFSVDLVLSFSNISDEGPETFKSKPFKINTMNYFKILNVNRLDDYQETCKDTILAKGKDPILCIPTICD